MDTIELGKKIAEIRRQKGITQEELAAKANVNVRTIQRIEKGEVDPRSYTINEIATALDVDPGLLLEQRRSDSRLWVILLHMSNYVPILLIAILIFALKKDEAEEIYQHGKKVLNFQISMFFLLMGAGFLAIVLIGMIIAPLLGIFIWIITTVNILRYVGGHEVNYPLSMKIIK